MLMKEVFTACHCVYRRHYDCQEHGNFINIIGNKKRTVEYIKSNLFIWRDYFKNIEHGDQMVLTETLV